jgi:uncharacterized protein
MKKNISAWIIIDDKIGNANQAKALAESMKINYTVKTLKYNFLGCLPNWLKFDSLLGVNLELSDDISEPYPDLIISCGRKTAAVSSYIKKMNPETFIVHLMHPDLPFENFDLIALPLHDLTEKHAGTTNISYTIGAPSYIDNLNLEKAGAKLKKDLPKLKAPFVSLIIGGKTKAGNYTSRELEKLIEKASSLTKDINGSLLISTSRRTDKGISKQLQEKILSPYYLYDWHEEKAQNNPYHGFLALSDYIIATGDSVSTCSEALSTGKPVYIYRKNNLLYKKHIKFLDYLLKLNYTRDLEEASKLEKWSYDPLQEAERLGKTIKEKLNANNNISSKNT